MLAAAVLSCALFLVVFDSLSIATALPSIGRGLQLRPSSLQWVVNAYSLFIAGFLLVGGRAADLFGRRRMLVTSLALLGIGTGFCAFSPGLELFLLGRSLQGTAAALALPAALALTGALFVNEPGRSKAFSIMSVTGGVAGIAGAVVGGLLTGAFGWRWVFLGTLPLNALAVVLTVRVVPADVLSPQRKRQQLDLPGAVLATCGLVALVYAFSRVEQSGLLGRDVLISLVLAVIGGTAFFSWERRSRAPLIQPMLLRSRRLLGCCAGIAAASAIHSAVVVLGSLHLQQVHGFTPTQTGLALAPALLATSAGSVLAGRLVPRFGSRLVAAVGLPIAASALGLWAAGARSGSYLTAVLPWLVIQGLSNSANYVALTREAVADAAEEVTDEVLGAAVTDAIQQSLDSGQVHLEPDVAYQAVDTVHNAVEQAVGTLSADGEILVAEDRAVEAVQLAVGHAVEQIRAENQAVDLGAVEVLVNRTEEAIEEAGDEVDHGSAAGVFEASTHIGGALAVAILVTMAGSGAGFQGAYSAATGLAVLGWVLMLVLVPDQRRRRRLPRLWRVKGRPRRELVVQATRQQLRGRVSRRQRSARR